MNSKIIFCIALLSTTSTTFSSNPKAKTQPIDDSWDLIEDLEDILREEERRIEKELSTQDKTTAYNTALKKAKALDFNEKNITNYLDLLNNTQIKAILNTWLNRAIIAYGQGTLPKDIIKNTCEKVMNTYPGLLLTGSVPKINKTLHYGGSLPETLYFDFYDQTKYQKIKSQSLRNGSFGEYYWDSSTLGSITRNINETLAKSIQKLFKRESSTP